MWLHVVLFIKLEYIIILDVFITKHFKILILLSKFTENIGCLIVSSVMFEVCTPGECLNPPISKCVPGHSCCFVVKPVSPTSCIISRMAACVFNCSHLAAQWSSRCLCLPSSPMCASFVQRLPDPSSCQHPKLWSSPSHFMTTTLKLRISVRAHSSWFPVRLCLTLCDVLRFSLCCRTGKNFSIHIYHISLIYSSEDAQWALFRFLDYCKWCCRSPGKADLSWRTDSSLCGYIARGGTAGPGVALF